MPPNIKGRDFVLRITKKVPGNTGQMSDPSAIILGMYDKWNKYTHVCQTCDALIEYTSKRVVREITCECGGKSNWVSQEPATIQPTNEREQMTTSSFTTDEQVTALQTKIENLEGLVQSLQNQLTSSTGRYNELRSQLNKIIDNMTEDYWYNPNTRAETILSDLCEILNHEPKKEITFSARIIFNGRIDVPLADAEDFDLSEVLAEAYVDINNGDVVIDDYELYDAEER